VIHTKNLALKKQVFDSIRRSVTGGREGIHLSDLVYCTRKAYWRSQGYRPEPTDEQCLLWLTGYAFQAYMFPLDKEITYEVDGINCTPDIPTGVEVKSTRQSLTNFDFDSMGHWQRQILGYCKALGKLEYDLVVMFVCGNYKPPFPDLECYHIEATQEEVDTNWALIQRKRDKLVGALMVGVPPPIDCDDWEWKYCECVDLCADSECYRKKSLLGTKGGK